MELLSKFEYTLVALLELAASYPSGEPLQIQEIATLQDIRNRYLEQLLATLRRKGLIKSVRGAKGGYVLAKNPTHITIMDALSCIESLEPTRSTKNNTSKRMESEILHEIWQEAWIGSKSVLQKYTLQDLYERRKVQQQGSMYYI